MPERRNVVGAVLNLLKDRDPVILHSHFDRYDMSALLLKAFYRRCKVVWHFHGIAPLTTKQWVKDVVKVRVFARGFGDLFIPVADGPYRNALERGFPSRRLLLNYNGIDTARFSTTGRRREEARALLGVSNDEVVFLLLGYDPFVKGVDTFIKAAEQVRQSDRLRKKFVVIARNRTRQFISQLLESVRLEKVLRIMDPIEDFALILDGIDALVAPSRREGLSYAVPEAMAAGKLVLCSDIPGVRENYAGAGGVWLFPTEDWEQLSLLMTQAAELPSDDRARLGQQNSQFVTERYSLGKWAERIGDMYSELLHDPWRPVISH